MSTKPGATTHPVASMTSVASPSTCSPTATITPRSIATSPTKAGRPVPSTMVPPVIFSSNIARAYRAVSATRDAVSSSVAEGSPQPMGDSVNGATGGRGRPEKHRRPIAAQGLGHLPDVIPGALVLDAREPELEQCREDEVQVSVRHVHQ